MLFLYPSSGATFYSAIDSESLIEDGYEVPPEANSIKFMHGYDPSVACLLLEKFVINTIVTTDFHALKLASYNKAGNLVEIVSLKWVFSHAVALNAATATQLGGVYAVYFCDARLLFARSAPTPIRTYNLVSKFVPEPVGPYDPYDPGEFPYDPESLNGSVPWTWQTMFEDLWSVLPTTPFLTFPALGSVAFPVDLPLHVRFENQSAWGVFIDMLHSIGWEFYHLSDGTYKIAAIDDHIGQPSLLPDSTSLIDSAFPIDEAERLPEYIRVAFLMVNRAPEHTDEVTFYFVDVLTTSVIVGTPAEVIGAVEIITTRSEVAVFREADPVGASPENTINLLALAQYLVTRVVRQRLGPGVANVYSGFHALGSNPETPFAEHIVDDFGPTTTVKQVDYDLNPRYLPLVDQVGGAGVRMVRGYTTDPVKKTDNTFEIVGLTAIVGELPDEPLTVHQVFPVGYSVGTQVLAIQSSETTAPELRIVAGDWINTPDQGKVLANSLDVKPEYLWDSIVDHNTFDEGYHQPVYAEAVEVMGDADNYRVKLFTDLGTGGGGAPVNVALFAYVVLDGPFNYDDGQGIQNGFAGWAPVRSISGFWGIGTPTEPVITQIFDIEGSFKHHRAGDGLLVQLNRQTSIWYALQYERPPELLWIYSDSPGAVDGETLVNPIGTTGIYTAQVIRYVGGNPQNSGSYTIVNSDVNAFILGGKQRTVRHREKFSGFWCGGAIGLPTYAITSQSNTDSVAVIIRRVNGVDNAINGATRTGPGPEILPTFIDLEPMSVQPSGRLVPSGFPPITCIYRDGEPVPNPKEGHVWIAETQPLSSGEYLITCIYCTEWED